MSGDSEFSKNAVKMKMCKKAESITFFTYLISGIIIICYSFVSMVGLSWDAFYVMIGSEPTSQISFLMIIDSIVVAPLGFFLAYRGTMKHHDLSAMCAAALEAANFGLFIFLKVRHFFDRVPVAFLFFSIYSIVCIIVSVINIRSNVRYHWLEKQIGFPLFNERFQEQVDDKFQRGIMDQFEQRVSRLKKTATDEMTDAVVTNETLEEYVYEHKPSSMDEI